MVELEEVVAIAAGGIGLPLAPAGTMATILLAVEDDRGVVRSAGRDPRETPRVDGVGDHRTDIHRMSWESRFLNLGVHVADLRPDPGVEVCNLGAHLGAACL